MKSYKEYRRDYIGGTDIAAFILVGCRDNEENGLAAQILRFGGDGAFSAYVVDENAEIGDHYTKVCEFNHWMKVYDDQTMTAFYDADKIVVYRAGCQGCIFQLIGAY